MVVTRVCVCVSVCVSVCLSAAACPHYCTDPDVTWGSGRGCPLVVHYWTDLQSVHGLRCYDNITRTRNVSEHMLVLALLSFSNIYRCNLAVVIQIIFVIVTDLNTAVVLVTEL